MNKTIIRLASMIGWMACAGPVFPDPALIYDLGQKYDKSFNESAFNGAERWRTETGGSFREVQLQSEAQREQAIRRAAEAGDSPVVMVGFSFGTALATVAPDYPDTRFVIIDMVVEMDNVRSVVFKEHEGSYLVGLIAGMTTESGVIGFVGGMDVPLIRRFACGYVQGAKAARENITVIQNMTGTDPSAWSDPVKGAELALAQIGAGADVVYHAAGATGIGVLKTAADSGILGIGVDLNQNHLYPGSVLTSMIKRVDLAVETAFADGAQLETGIFPLGLAEDGIGYALDEHNAALIGAGARAAAETARKQIISGEIAVHDYIQSDSCPVQ
ncbi:MAG: BMP family ABC transporter substrate-binding protein [Gammaproteobacteria bacterium]|nr:BMP family ABC transporter substrate-binding protein [Gammaproteobacteria bacterium]MYD75269.1 BMP family ABC transporter substrate-binding protein [Gammaproteobacteria bacterium]MYJ51364.1 BMP family ABC transporter substrate-binding protein [Gammaproteobacteria bacterium]